jgi:hypothetical protein
MTSTLIGMPTKSALARAGSRLALLALIASSACSHSGAPPSLGDLISVEQAGGGATQLIASGTQLPTSATESFTTAHDGDKKLYIHVLRGSAKKAGKLTSDGWWTVDGVPDAAAGVARVFVTFELDAKGDLTLSARQDAVKLKAARLDKLPDGQKPSPLTEPDDDDEGPDESE